MGTHVWNSIPSRRGRRMSVDGLQPPGGLGISSEADPLGQGKCLPPLPADYFTGSAGGSGAPPQHHQMPPHPTAALYPFQFPFGTNGFPGGSPGAGPQLMAGAASKLNEISVIQNRMLQAAQSLGPSVSNPTGQ